VIKIFFRLTAVILNS